MTFKFQITFNDGPTSAGDSPQLSGRISGMVVTNNSGESIGYSSDSGSSFATLTAGSSVTLGAGDPTSFRFRRVNSGSYPLAVDAVVTMSVPMSEGYFDTNPTTGVGSLLVGGQTFSLESSYTWAQLTSLTGMVSGDRAIVSDMGGAVFVYNGARWTRMEPLILSSGGIPLILPSGGTVGNNGALTLTTALNAIYPKCFMYFKDNAIVAGSAAGMYYVEMSSTTAGVIYNNYYWVSNAGRPVVPTTKVSFVTTGPGAYTQTVGLDLPLLMFKVPGKLLGPYGILHAEYTTSCPNNANTKSVKDYFGNTGLGNQLSTHQSTSLKAAAFAFRMANRGDETKQIGGINNTSGYEASGSQLQITGSADSATDCFYRITANIAVETDFLVIESHHVLAYPS